MNKPLEIAFYDDTALVTRGTDREIGLISEDMVVTGNLSVPWEELELAPYGNNRDGALSGIAVIPGGKGFFVTNEHGQTSNQKSTYGRTDQNSEVVGGKLYTDATQDDNEPILRAVPADVQDASAPSPAPSPVQRAWDQRGWSHFFKRSRRFFSPPSPPRPLCPQGRLRYFYKPHPRMPRISLRIVTLALIASGMGCHRTARDTGTLPKRGYLWQREWTPAVVAGFREAEKRMDEVVVLGAEIGWGGGVVHSTKASIVWEELRNQKVALAIRVGRYDGSFAGDDGAVRAIATEAQRLLDAAHTHGVQPTELQLDFDCAQKKLTGYRAWVKALKAVVMPLPLVITALPAWLGEPDFPALAREADGYVLQVHSVPTLAEGGHAALCDPALARKWVARASALGMPFSVSLPAYWCVAGYDPHGKLLGVAMDSVQPAWPPGTSMLEFSANADEIAALVSEWKLDRPTGMKELLWYRVPIATDQRNWRWPTLAAVMAGRSPAHCVEAICEGDNPVDVSIVNRGEAGERAGRTVTLHWSGAAVTESDALPGWNVSVAEEQAVFATAPGAALRLSPGEQRSIGWLKV